MAEIRPDAALPPLREDLRLFPGATREDGSPSWVLQDPTRNRFFHLGWGEFELLRRWELGSPVELLRRVNAETALNLGQRNLEALTRFLVRNQLTTGQGEVYRESLRRIADASRSGFASWLLHHYLFIRVPLVRPQRFLQASWPLVRPLFSRGFALFMLGLSLFALLLISRRWDEFTHTLLHFQSIEGLLLFAIALSFAKIIHELGHAYASVRHGVKVSSMGVALLVLWPVLYTEASDAWKLRDKRQRLAIGAAGMLAELSLAAVAALLWNFLDDGPLRSAVFLLATSTWVLTLLVNLNPLMRFDGYYLLSDWLDIPNLQERSFELARWRLRELLFGFGRPPPERLPEGTRTFLILFAWGTWIYRFFLFLGIALLVYFLFFKLLGIFLLLVELGWFIARPILHETAEWLKSSPEMRWNRNSLISLSLLAGAGVLLLLPWQGHTLVPAMVQHAQQARLHAPEAGRIIECQLQQGQEVAAGAVLLRIDSPDLAHRIQVLDSEVRILELQQQRKASDEEYLESRALLERQLAETRSRLEGLRQQQQRLTLHAPFAGRIAFVEPTLRTGRWVDPSLTLVRLVAPGRLELEAFVEGRLLPRLDWNQAIRFYPDSLFEAPFEVQRTELEETNTRYLDRPYFASEFGGELPVRRDEEGRLAAETTLFRVRFEPLEDRQLEQVERGRLRLALEPRSLIAGWWEHAAAVLVRETGF